MDLWTLLVIAARRWVVVLLVLLVTAPSAVWMASRLEVLHLATSWVVLVPRSSHDVGAAAAAAQQQLPQTATVVAELLRGDDVRARLDAPDATTDYEVEVAVDAPLIRIRVDGEDEDVVLATALQLLDAAGVELAARPTLATGADGVRVAAQVVASPEAARAVPGTDGRPTTYVAEGSVLLAIVTPPLPANAGNVNPFRELGGAAVGVLADLSTSTAFAAELEAAGIDATFAVEPDGQAPILQLTATAATADEARRAVLAVHDALVEELHSGQEAADAPESSLLSLAPLSEPEVEEVAPGRVRSVAIILAMGMVAALSLAALVDGIATRRRDVVAAGAVPPPDLAGGPVEAPPWPVVPTRSGR